jgi:uncharacterized protein YlxP (DUF503 family)
MIVLRMHVQLRLNAAGSLKEKRMVLRSVRDRLRNRFNVAVAEVGAQDEWRMIELGIVSVGSDVRVVDSELASITRFLDSDARFEMVERAVEYH